MTFLNWITYFFSSTDFLDLKLEELIPKEGCDLGIKKAGCDLGIEKAIPKVDAIEVALVAENEV